MRLKKRNTKIQPKRMRLQSIKHKILLKRMRLKKRNTKIQPKRMRLQSIKPKI